MKRKFSIITAILCLLTLCIISTAACSCTENGDDSAAKTISFFVEGELYVEVKTLGNTEIRLPDAPEKVGCTFDGWFFDADEWQNELDKSTYLYESLDKDVSVYAKFVQNELIDGLVFEGSSVVGYEGSSDVVEIPNYHGSVKITNVGANAFLNKSVVSITVSASVISVDMQAFKNCSCLTSVTLSKNLKYILVSAFSGCIRLREINLPSGLAQLGTHAFYNCQSLSMEQENGADYFQSWLISAPEDIANFTVKSGTIGIAGEAFRNNSLLTEVIIPQSVTAMDANAFVGCGSVNIYAEASSQPIGWVTGWAGNALHTYWYSEKEAYNGWRWVDNQPVAW